MKCSECGHDLEVRQENHRYDESGLPNVILQQVEVRRCPDCGKEVVAIPAITHLHTALVRAVIRKPAALTPAEFKFLRKYLGWSGADTARHLGVQPETVSRWESGASSIGAIADRLIRTCVALVDPVEDYSVDTLAGIVVGSKEPETRFQMFLGADKTWRGESSVIALA